VYLPLYSNTSGKSTGYVRQYSNAQYIVALGANTLKLLWQ